MKLLSSDHTELMDISTIDREGDRLVIRGKVFGAMPMTAYLSASQARQGLRLLNWKMVLFVLSLPFRRN